jgi:hypothetical protein
MSMNIRTPLARRHDRRRPARCHRLRRQPRPGNHVVRIGHMGMRMPHRLVAVPVAVLAHRHHVVHA